jgi:hypothetical protein
MIAKHPEQKKGIMCVLIMTYLCSQVKLICWYAVLYRLGDLRDRTRCFWYRGAE